MKYFVQLVESKKLSQVKVIKLSNAACLATASAKLFPVVFIMASLECSGILIIGNCLNFFMTSNNTAAYFYVFMGYREKVMKL